MKVIQHWFFLFALLATVVITINLEGLHGPFLLDDTGNLESLDKLNTNPNYKWYNLLSDAQQGGSGRPVSLLTFIINAPAWPDNPLPFKITNMIIHILNVFLIYILAFQISKTLGNTSKISNIVSFITALAWAVHPIQQSTVFYIIQRMTQLSTFFMLIGINYYIYHRSKYDLNKLKNYLTLSIIYSACLILGVLSKENGLLLCLFVLLTEAFLFSKTKDQWKKWLSWGSLFSIVPILLFMLYVIYIWDTVNNGYLWREFNLYERILTQFAVLSDYIFFIFTPTLSDSTLFHDDFPISRSFFEPRTILSFIFISSFIIAGVALRKKLPIVSFGIAWFFAGHLIESTILPLELYFEHRNYLSSFGFIFTFAYLAIHIPEKIRIFSYFLLSIYITLLLTLSFLNASIWGNEDILINVWAKERKHSPRAVQNQAIYWHRYRENEKAYETLKDSRQLHPLNLSLRLQELQFACDLRLDEQNLIDNIIKISPIGHYDHSVTQTLMNIVRLHMTGKCTTLTFKQLLTIVQKVKSNPKYQNNSNLANLDYVIGVAYSGQGDLNAAMKYMDMSLNKRQSHETALLQAGWLASAGLYKEALTYLNKAQKIIDNYGSYKRKDYSEVNQFRKQILIDMKTAPPQEKNKIYKPPSDH